jgi:uncharacterized 2Fe-2S/4Fe-4S cluster protein (DUF4445 family)
MKKVVINFAGQNKQVEVEEGISIAAACRQAGIRLDLVCGGRGKCGKCAVDIKTVNEEKKVLACQEKVLEAMDVMIPDEIIAAEIVVLTGTDLGEIVKKPGIKKLFVPRKEVPEPECYGDWQRLADYLGPGAPVHIQLPLLRRLPGLLRNRQISGITLVQWGEQLLDIEEGDAAHRLFGIAVDVGTTTIAGYLYDLNTGERLAVSSALNGQVAEGADVMSRIVAAGAEGGLERLQQLVADTINRVIAEAAAAAGVNKSEIYQVLLVGNTTMQHLFFGLTTEYLGRSPFMAVHQGEINVFPQEAGVDINPRGIVTFLPLIGGFVGADTTGVILATGMYQSKALKLMIDIGTNGEIVLGNEAKMLACSTAAGPALEGAGIEFGMRGTDGAIEKVKFIDGRVELQVIGNTKIKGICGSGLVDLAAEMLKAGIIDKKGKILTREEFLASGAVRLAERLREINGLKVFVVAEGEETAGGEVIYLSQKDIRSLQLAKGAIYTGCIILLEEYGVLGEELEEIMLAGAFGNYIDVGKAQLIGLIPNFSGVPVRPIGNGAGAGAQLALLSTELKEAASNMLIKIDHIELATHKEFQERFIMSLNF